MTEDATEKAKLLIRAIQNELNMGTRHFNDAGQELTSLQDIIQTLIDEGHIHFEPVPGRQEYMKRVMQEYLACLN